MMNFEAALAGVDIILIELFIPSQYLGVVFGKPSALWASPVLRESCILDSSPHTQLSGKGMSG